MLPLPPILRRSTDKAPPVPTDGDLTLLDGGMSFDDEGRLEYYWFHLRQNGRTFYKVVILYALTFLPREVREQMTVLEKMRKVLRGVWSSGIPLVYLAAGIFPQPGIVQCYGVQANGETLEEARGQAMAGMAALLAAMANYEQARLEPLSVDVATRLRRTLSEMNFATVVIGQPDPREGARGMSAAEGPTPPLGQVGLQQNEYLLRGFAQRREPFLEIVMGTPVPMSDITRLQERVAHEAGIWASKVRFTRSVHGGVSMPLILSGTTGDSGSQSYGVSEGYGVSDAVGEARALSRGSADQVSESHTVTDTVGQNWSTAHSQGISTVISRGRSHTVGFSDGVSETRTVGGSETHGTAHTVGQAATEGRAHTEGTARSHTESVGGAESWSTARGQTETHGVADTNSWGRSHVVSRGAARSHVVTDGQSWSHTDSVSDAVAHTRGTSETSSWSRTTGVNVGASQTQGVSESGSWSQSTQVSQGVSQTQGASESASWSQSAQVSRGEARAEGTTYGETESHSYGEQVHASLSAGAQVGVPGTGVHASTTVGGGASWSDGHASSVGYSESASQSTVLSQGGTLGGSQTLSHSTTQSAGVTQGSTVGGSVGASQSATQSVGVSQSSTTGGSRTSSQSTTHTHTVGHADTVGGSHSVSRGLTRSWGVSEGRTVGGSHSVSHTTGTSLTQTEGGSRSWGASDGLTRSVADTVSRAVTRSSADTTSHAVSRSWSTARGTTHTRSVADAISQGIALGRTSSVTASRGGSVSHAEARTRGASHTESQSVTDTRSRQHGASHTVGSTLGQSLGWMRGLGLSAGLAPSLGFSKTYAGEDHTAALVAQALGQQEQILRTMSLEGGLLVDHYILTGTPEGRRMAETLVPQAFHGVEEVATPVRTRRLTPEAERYIRAHANVFAQSCRPERSPWALEPWADSSLLTMLQAATYVAPGVFEEGLAVTTQERIPPFAFRADMEGDVVLGHFISYETGQVTDAPVRLSRDKMANWAFAADTGYGKSVAAERLVLETTRQWRIRSVVLDFGAGWRKLLRMLPNHCTIYGLYPGAPNPLRWNPLQIGRRIAPEIQLAATCELMVNAGRMGERQHGWLRRFLRELYVEHGVLVDDPQVWGHERWGRVQEDERELINEARGQRGLPPLPAGEAPLSRLAPWERQLLAVERSKAVDLVMLYHRLEHHFENNLKPGTPDHTSMQGLLLRLEAFVHGAAARMYVHRRGGSLAPLGRDHPGRGAHDGRVRQGGDPGAHRLASVHRRRGAPRGAHRRPGQQRPHAHPLRGGQQGVGRGGGRGGCPAGDHLGDLPEHVP